jgi:hypothetical protein
MRTTPDGQKADFFCQWTLAIAVDESIKPIQIRERSNKFIWSEAQDKPDKYGERAASIKVSF